MQPSPNDRRVGIRIVTFEACSGFTRVTARRIAQPPMATFVTRLRPRLCTTEPLVSYRTYRQLSGWNPPPLVIRAVRAHGHQQTKTRTRHQQLPVSSSPKPDMLDDHGEPTITPATLSTQPIKNEVGSVP